MPRDRRQIRSAVHDIVDPFVKSHDARVSGCCGVTLVVMVGIAAYGWFFSDKGFVDTLLGTGGIGLGTGFVVFFGICRTGKLAKETAQRFKKAFRDPDEYELALHALGRYDTSTGSAVSDLLEQLGEKLPASSAKGADEAVADAIDDLGEWSPAGIPIEDDPKPQRGRRRRDTSQRRGPLKRERPGFMPLEPEGDDDS